MLQLIGRVLGKLGIILLALLKVFDLDDFLEKGNLRDFIREKIGGLQTVFYERFGRGRIKVTPENAVLFFDSLILCVQKFTSLQKFHEFISAIEAQSWEQEALENEFRDVLEEIEYNTKKAPTS